MIQIVYATDCWDGDRIKKELEKNGITILEFGFGIGLEGVEPPNCLIAECNKETADNIIDKIELNGTFCSIKSIESYKIVDHHIYIVGK